MRRREFIMGIGGAAMSCVPWWRVARAQQTIAKIGYVTWLSETQKAPELDNLRRGLRELGYVEGKNIALESFFTAGDREHTREVIRRLVREPVDILIVRITPAIHIAKEETQTIPIIMIVADPLATGLVQSLSHPGGNITGVSIAGPELAGKRLELLREVRPGLRTVAFLGQASDLNAATFVRETQAAAKQISLDVVVKLVNGAAEIDAPLFAAMKREGAEAIIVQPVFISYREMLIKLAMNAQLPVISDFAMFARSGALLSFGVDQGETCASDRLLRGPHPQRRQAGRFAGGRADELSACGQSANGESAGLDYLAAPALARRRRDRMRLCDVGFGTSCRSTTSALISALRGSTDGVEDRVSG
jgi:putative ABC transport system substrate-binding protein